MKPWPSPVRYGGLILLGIWLAYEHAGLATELPVILIVSVLTQGRP